MYMISSEIHISLLNKKIRVHAVREQSPPNFCWKLNNLNAFFKT